MILGLDTTRSDDPLNSNLAGDPNPGDQNETPSFLTIQSLTYSGGIAVIGIVWALAQSMFPGDITRGLWVPVVLAALFIFAGLANVWADLADWGKKISAFVIALFNAAMLTAGALGITAVVGTATGS